MGGIAHEEQWEPLNKFKPEELESEILKGRVNDAYLKGDLNPVGKLRCSVSFSHKKNSLEITNLNRVLGVHSAPGTAVP